MSFVRKSREPEAPVSNRAAQGSPARSLRISDANDAIEREADRVADEVMPHGSAKQHWSLSDVNMAAPIHRKAVAGPAANTDPVSLADQVLSSPGRPLDRATREFFEPKFGHDLGDVRLHTDGAAAQSAEAMRATAYTVGRNLVLGSGTGPDQKPLLAHELAHVVQQNRAPGTTLNPEGPRLEAEAERAASAISVGSNFVPIHTSSAPRISRQTPPAAPTPSAALSFLGPHDIAKLQAFGNADYQASLDTL